MCKITKEEKIKERLLKAQELAIKNGGKLITTHITLLSDKLTWQCSSEHIWDATYSNVSNGKTWCPECSSLSSERICRKALSILLNCEFKKIKPDWLKFSTRNLELDGYCGELNIAFEHNGRQHYVEVKDFPSISLEKIQERDLFKANICNKLGIKLIIIPALIDILDPKELISFRW